ncbi:ABC transporter permease subunit [Mesomycoplasma molare]|uniref:ABC transporter permease subunit n=1 Tax=Mesomycoplasma molare TaxID=171288 RepID=A0ABY5TU41_9BACT|nr:ABC transporter permease subunit [Mesomycoplasma molare]UWD34187.1 ABC transporter permease subunit [Mesomycoplasma molare]
MEKIKMWNWYGEKFDKKINDSKLSYSNYLNQVQNVYDRDKRNLDLKKKINKDLFVKAKRNLLDEEKRSLDTLKISSKNQLQVVKETYKQLKIANSLISLIQFEIKKIDKKNLESAQYVSNYYKMLLKTADEASVKEENMTSILNKAQSDEKILLLNKIYLLIILKYLKYTKKNELDIVELEELLNKTPSIFKTIEIDTFYLSEGKERVIKLFNRLKNKQAKLLVQKEEIKKEIPEIKKASLSKLKEDVKNLKANYKQRILEAEFSYNKEYDEELSLLKNNLIERKNKVKERKEEIEKLSIEKEEKLKQYKQTKKLEEKEIFNTYKKELRLSLELEKIFNKYKKLLVINKILKLKQRNYIEHYYSLYKKQIINKYINTNEYNKDILRLTKYHFNSLYKKIYLSYKNTDDAKKNVIKIHMSSNLPLIFRWKYKANAIRFAKSKYLQKLGNSKKDHSYDGDFLISKSSSLFEYAQDTNKVLNYSADEIKKSKLILNKIKNSPTQDYEQEFKNNIKEIKENYKKKINELKLRYKNKDITKKAYLFKLKEEKILLKESIVSLKLNNEKEKHKVVVKTQYSRLSSQLKIFKKIYESKVVESIKQIPMENKKGAKYKGLFLNLLLPGLAQLFLFKEIKKGILLLLISLILYGLFVPFSFGLTWNKIGGIQGIIDLGASIHDFSLGILPDARFYMFGAAASLILLALTFSFTIANAVGAYRQGKLLEEGLRPQNWTQTKKWLSEQGFPWLISIPGWFLIAFIVLVPLMTSLFISLSNTGFQHTPPQQIVDWVGFTQYGKWWIFRSNGLLTSLSRVISWTLIWTFVTSISVIVTGTIFAILVNSEKVKFKKFFRLIYIIPWAIPAFVTIIFLKSAFQGDSNSLINYILIKLGIIKDGINFFGSIYWVRFLLIVIQTWLGHSYIFLLITGNLQSIPKDIYEAGEIDGAKRSKLFQHITLPILLSSLAPLLIGQFTFMFNNFTIISLFSNGGPNYSEQTVFQESGSDIIISWIYKLTTTVQIDGNIAFSSALVILASVFSVSIAAYGFAKSAAKGGK